MVWIACVAIMFGVTYAQHRNGLLTSAVMFVQVILAGLVAFNFWEPIADLLDESLQRSMLAGTEDAIALTLLFCTTVVILRSLSNRLAPELLDYHGYTQQIGSGVFGFVTGYLVSGFLVCVVQTLPLDERFLGYEPRGPSQNESALTSLLPPDRVWLAMMRYTGSHSLTWSEDNPEGDTVYDRYATFDRAGTFELRYQRYRRHSETRGPLPYQGEFNKDLGR